MNDFITGIQQVGIGVKNATESLHLYAKLFGMDTLVFDDVSDASLMSRYTGGIIYRRHAFLSMNLQGGGGFEIWQYMNRTPVEPVHEPAFGDIGIYAVKLKCSDVRQANDIFKKEKLVQVSGVSKDDKGDDHFWVTDASHNVFNIVTGNHWFKKKRKDIGGVSGAVIGVTDMDRSLDFYKSVLNIEKETYDRTGIYDNGQGGLKQNYRRVLLQKHPSGKGAFGKLLGSVEIELVQCLDRNPFKIYENRFWGDCGFIHLCVDVYDMCGLKKSVEQKGYAFSVDSVDSFGMENASGRFCYMEDPDGTLIELVETHKVPVLKKLGVHLDLRKRSLENHCLTG